MRKRQINRTADKYKFWSTLRLMQSEYNSTLPEKAFTDWVAEKYGIEIDIVDDKMYGSGYVIVDEAKHTFYKLKYG